MPIELRVTDIVAVLPLRLSNAKNFVVVSVGCVEYHIVVLSGAKPLKTFPLVPC